MSYFSRKLEASLLSDSWVAVWVLPILAIVFFGAALVGAGVLGDPDLPHDSIKASHSERTPVALVRADEAYPNWAGPTPQMSEVLVPAITANLALAWEDADFEGQSFAASPQMRMFLEAGLNETEAAGGPTSAGEGAIQTSPESNPELGQPSSADLSNAAGRNETTAALEGWTQTYWCERQAWNDLWLEEIVRPLVARGVGECSWWDRFSARSPLISYFNDVWGVIAFFALSLFAALLVFLSVSQLALREAYRLQYRSSQFPK